MKLFLQAPAILVGATTALVVAWTIVRLSGCQ